MILVVIILFIFYFYGLKYKMYNFDIKKELFGDCDNLNYFLLGKKKCIKLKGLNL